MERKPRNTLVLLTDFGTRDPYVGVMKLVVLSRVQRPVNLVDLSHDVPPQDLHVAARMIRCSRPYLPPASVWLIVVDPGVGTSRRAIAFELRDGSAGVAPDNGVLTPLKRDVVAASRLPIPPEASTTFHGRDVFAPAAARLLEGAHPHDLGVPVEPKTLKELPAALPVVRDEGIQGRVVDVDRFGNLITNIPADLFQGRPVRVHVAGKEIPLVRTYADVEPGALLALVGSCGELEISVRNGSAARHLRAGIGTDVWVFFSS